MPDREVLLVHYSEIALKGGNRSFFERALARNLKRAIGVEDVLEIERPPGRVVVKLKEPLKRERIEQEVRKVFGVSWFAFAEEVECNYEAIERAVLGGFGEALKGAESFVIRAVRAHKGFPLDSTQLNTKLGEAVVRALGTKVDLDHPALTVGVEVLKDRALVYGQRLAGPGGLPVGSGGRVLCLLSGGIDSPVAPWLAMKRGTSPSYVHFHPFSDNKEAEESKIGDIVKYLTAYSGRARCTFVPTYPFSVSAAGIPARHDVVLFRRFMLMCAEKVAEKARAKALVTGESLAQVASQTLDNMAVIHRAVDMPILMPLVSYDKDEIVALAKKIGTLDMSLRPYKDCCSIIARHPETRAKLGVIEELERKMEVEKLVDECLAEATCVDYR